MNRILIAAGTPALARDTQAALSGAGFQTAVVSDSAQLASFCAAHVPDLALIDLSLPGGNLWTTTQALRADSRLSAMPLVGLESGLGELERQQAAAAGFALLLGQPLAPDALLSGVRQALSAATQATNVTPMTPLAPASPSVHDPVGALMLQAREIRSLTVDLKPGAPGYGEEGPELFEYIENSGAQILNELGRLAAEGPERSSIALLDKDLRHDFRNMIGSVTGFSELLLMEPTVTGEARAKFTRIREICRDFCNLLDEQKAAAA